MLQGTGSSMLKDENGKVYAEEPKCRRTFRVFRRLVIDARGILLCHAQRKSSCALATRKWKLWHVKRRGVEKDKGYTDNILKIAEEQNHQIMYTYKEQN